MEARDLVRLRTPLIVLFLCLLLALAAGWHAYVQEESATAQARSANASFREARNRYEAARRDEALMRLTIKRFRVLEAQHMIGAEERLGWIERLRAARESAGLAQLSYELRPASRYCVRTNMADTNSHPAGCSSMPTPFMGRAWSTSLTDWRWRVRPR